MATTSRDEENEFDVMELGFNLFIRFEANEILDLQPIYMVKKQRKEKWLMILWREIVC